MKTKIAILVVSVVFPILSIHSEPNDFVGAIVQFQGSADERTKIIVENFENQSGLVLSLDSTFEIGFYANQKGNEKRAGNSVSVSFDQKIISIELTEEAPVYRIDATGLTKIVDSSVGRSESVGLQVIDWRVGNNLKFNYYVFVTGESERERPLDRKGVTIENEEK